MAVKEYIFTSERLGFRNWEPTDLESMSVLNADPYVMQYFPSLQTRQQTAEFIAKMQKQFIEKGFTYFAVDTLAEKEFIGFIGLSIPTFEADFTPCVDMGWRLKRDAWNKGYATEGALRCISFAQNAGIQQLFAIAPAINTRSEQVMIKSGMRKLKTFDHPNLRDFPHLQACVLYHIALR
jgi:RimJ/RimL family protein N-acetyltransferase